MVKDKKKLIIIIILMPRFRNGLDFNRRGVRSVIQINRNGILKRKESMPSEMAEI
jgi:hypothetical protein